MSNSVEEDVAITGKIRSMTILSNGNKVMRNETPSDESNDSDDDIDDYQRKFPHNSSGMELIFSGLT